MIRRLSHFLLWKFLYCLCWRLQDHLSVKDDSLFLHILAFICWLHSTQDGAQRFWSHGWNVLQVLLFVSFFSFPRDHTESEMPFRRLLPWSGALKNRISGCSSDCTLSDSYNKAREGKENNFTVCVVFVVSLLMIPCLRFLLFFESPFCSGSLRNCMKWRQRVNSHTWPVWVTCPEASLKTSASFSFLTCSVWGVCRRIALNLHVAPFILLLAVTMLMLWEQRWRRLSDLFNGSFFENLTHFQPF